MERFRPATAEDVDAITEMMAQLYAEDGYPFIESEARSVLLALIREDHFGRR